MGLVLFQHLSNSAILGLSYTII